MAEDQATPGKEPFWIKVRNALEPRKAASSMAPGQAISPPSMRASASVPSLPSNGEPGPESSLETVLSYHWARCGARRVSIAVLTIEAEGTLYEAAATIGENLPRPDDRCFISGDRHVVVLADYPMLMAKVVARRLSAALGANARIGVAIANPADGAGDSLVGASERALAAAKVAGEGPIGAIDLRSLSRGAA